MKPPRPALLLTCGVIAGPLFVATFTLAGALRPDYNSLRHPVSSLALGGSGWIQVVNFLLAGALGLACAFGLHRALGLLDGSSRSTWGPLLIGVFGAGLIGAGLFTSDPVSGYPLGTPNRPAHYGSSTAAVHDGVSLLAFAALVAACAVLARRFSAWGMAGWAVYSAATGLVCAAGIVLSNLGFEQREGLVQFGGLFQRVAIIAGWAWIGLLALRLRHRLGHRSGIEKRRSAARN